MNDNQDNKNFKRIMAGLYEAVDIAEGRAMPARIYVPKKVSMRDKLKVVPKGTQ